MGQTRENCKDCCPGEMGPAGPQGLQGLQGVAGPNGQAGQAGLQGNMGPAGPAGANGVDGASGVGLPGPMGPAGPAGPVGVSGAQGQPGQNGAIGPVGPQGLQGLQGLQGVAGDCVACPCECDGLEFAEAYSSLVQTLSPSLSTNAAGGVVLFENVIVSTANIDSSQTGINGKFKVKLAGWYDVAAGMTGTLNPIPAPLPVWTLSLFLNGVIVSGSTFSNVPLSPAQSSSEITADTYVYCNVGDEIQLANTSTSVVYLTAPTLGTNAQTNSAYLKIQSLRLGPK